MQVPTRKPGKYTNLKSDPHITREKYNELKINLEKLKRKRPPVIEEVKRLAADGDFSENAAYQIAKGRLRGINRRIDEITDHLNRAVIIKTPKSNDRVSLGHYVTVEINGRQRTYLILGSSETNPADGVISNNSPLGSALIGRKAGETIRIELNEKKVEYKIIGIE